MSSVFKRARGRPRGGGRGHFIRVGANGRARSCARRRQNLARWWGPVGLERRLARDRLRPTGKPQRIRLSVGRGMAPPAGAFVEAKAQLNPPLQPLRPGSYDFARDLYFQRIGASGFVHGTVKVVTPPVEAGWRLRAVTFVESVRDAIDERIRSVLSGDVGSIAS